MTGTSEREKKIIFKEKEVVVGTGETVVVKQWSAYKFFKVVPGLANILEKVTGEKLKEVVLEDPQKAFDQLEDLIVNNVMEDIAGVFKVAAEELYQIIKITIDQDDEWMNKIPADDLIPLTEAVLAVCITKDIVKKVSTLLAKGLTGGKKKSSRSGK